MKIKLKNKLSLNKEIVTTLGKQQLNQIKGGRDLSGSTNCPPDDPCKDTKCDELVCRIL